MLTHQDLTAWAGPEQVTRATPDEVAGWRIPAHDKELLVTVGVPMVAQLVEHVAFRTDPVPALRTSSGTGLHQLTRNHHGDAERGLLWAFAVEPDTGTVYYVLPDGDAWFANSSIELWLRTLHHYGRRVRESPALSVDPDEHEEETLAELRELADELAEIDPPAFAGYRGFIWPEFLARWLW